MVDSGAAHSACPPDYANEDEVREVQRKIQFQTASGELLEHHGEKLVPRMTQDTVMGITYQVTDVEGPVPAQCDNSVLDPGEALAIFHHLIFDEWVLGALDMPVMNFTNEVIFSFAKTTSR